MVDCLRGHDKLTAFSLSNFTVDQDEVCLDELIKALGTIATLKKVVLESHREAKANFTGEALAELCADNKFEELRIANFRLYPQHYDLIAEAVSKTTYLRTLRLNRVGMAQPCLVKLAAGVKSNNSLRLIDLSSNNIEDVGIAALADALKTNTTVTHLRLWDNKLVTEEGFMALADMLQVNNTIEKVDLPSMASHDAAKQVQGIIADKRNALAV